MIKHVRDVAAAATASILLALPAQANVIFSAEYLERWPAEGQESPFIDGGGDEFGFRLTPMDAGSYNINIDAIVIEYADNIVNDPVDSDTYNSETGSTAPDAEVELFEADAFFNAGLGIGPFDFFGFGVGDDYEVFIDVDLSDGSAYVPGAAMFGSFIDVLYTDFNAVGGPLQGFASGNFGQCVDDVNQGAFCASAFLEIQATPSRDVPAPMSLALLGIGLLGLGWRRRK